MGDYKQRFEWAYNLTQLRKKNIFNPFSKSLFLALKLIGI